ncbi:cysteine-rich with EGF-like domain protein 2 [Amphiura filiformis]|uniref:cysteine-rich with EGF-like domain protein 2 n=1 Tax=Amphiura filiformis TaxID=82378 RepID=UPI003B218B1C
MMARRVNWLDCSLILLILASFICWNGSVFAKKKKSSDIIKRCETCRDLVKKFNEGIERTERYNFAGGDVDWEEKKLGSYATSETRFIEITEQLCSSSAHECHSMLEKQEEKLEEWWKQHQESDPDLEQWLCIDAIEVCCPENRYGPECDECLGGTERPCRDNGKCAGSGTRGGTGKCKCNGGYKGWYCEVCKNGFYEELKNDTHTICRACDDACASTCTGAGPKLCSKCKGGYVLDEEEGCKDIDECDKETHAYPCEIEEYCENNQGSYKCNKCDKSCNRCLGAGNTMCVSCKEGYKLEEGVCLDINECEKEDLCQADMICKNIPGSYFCDCHEGYERMGGECVDKEVVKALKENKQLTMPDPELGIKENGENTDAVMDENSANIDLENEAQNVQLSAEEEIIQQQTKEDSSFQSQQDVSDPKHTTEGTTQPNSDTNSDTIDTVNSSHQNGDSVADENSQRTLQNDVDTADSQNIPEIREEL